MLYLDRTGYIMLYLDRTGYIMLYLARTGLSCYIWIGQVISRCIWIGQVRTDALGRFNRTAVLTTGPFEIRFGWISSNTRPKLFWY